MENNVPEDIIKAIIAAGGNSRAARSARSRKQLRDRYGRWIEMGGGLSFKFRMPNGEIAPVVGRSVGGSDSSDDAVQVYVPSSNRPDIREGFYTVPASSSETAQALLSEEQLKRAGIDTDSKDGSLDAGVVDFNDAIFADAPEGWTKNEDGSFTTIEDNITITPNEDGTFSLSQDGEDKGSFNNIGDAIVKSNDLDAEAELPEADKKKVAELRDAGDEDAANRLIRNEPIAMLPEGAPAPTEGLINEDIANMSPEELKAARQDALDKIAAERALPEDDQDPDLLDSLGERITDITIRENEIAGLNPSEPLTFLPADKDDLNGMSNEELQKALDEEEGNTTRAARIKEILNNRTTMMTEEQRKAVAGWLEAIGGGNNDGGDTTPPPAADTPNESGADLLAQFQENNKNWNDAYKRSRDESLSQEERDAASAEIADIREKNKVIDQKLSELFKSDFASAEAVIEFYDENDEDRSLLSWDDVRGNLGGEDWILNAPAGAQALYFFNGEDGDEDLLVADGNGNWVGAIYSLTSDELIEKYKSRNGDEMRLVPVPSDAPESEADRVARIYKEHEAIPASDFQVGDDSNSAFLKEAPIGAEVSYRKDMEDAEGPYEATIKFTKTGDDEWTATGDDSVEGETWSAEELSTDRDTYTIDKIAGEEQVAELPAQGETPTAEATPTPAAETLPSAAPRSNVYGDTNDLPTLQRRLAAAEARLDRMGNDIMGRFSDEDMALIDQQIESLNERIDAINAGEEPAIDAPIENLPEIRSVAADTTNPNTYAADVTKLEEATTASEQAKVASDIAVKADKNNDVELASKAAEVVAAAEVFEEAETAETTPELKKNLTTFAKALIERLQETTAKLQEAQRKAKTNRNALKIEQNERRIAAIQQTLDFMEGKTNQQEDYDPRATREYVLANTTLFEDTIVRNDEGKLVSAEGVYVAPTGVVYNMAWDHEGGVFATLASDMVDPKTGVTYSANSEAGYLRIHRIDDPDSGPIIQSRDGLPELDKSTEYIIPAMIKAKSFDNVYPFKTIGAGMHGFAAAMANLDGLQYQHSSHLLPNGRVASHAFHTSQPLFHSRSQREKMFDLLKSPTSRIMRKLGYHKRGRNAKVQNASFDTDTAGNLVYYNENSKRLWWGEFDRHVDTNIAKFAVIMFNRHRNNPDAVPGVDYPKFLQEYIKGGDHTKIEQLSLADVFYSLNYEGADRAAVATKFRNVLTELQDWVANQNNGTTDVYESNIPNIGGHWQASRSVTARLERLFTVLGDVTDYLENPSNKIEKPLPEPESANTELRMANSPTKLDSIEALPTLEVPRSALSSDLIFGSSTSADNVREVNANFTEDQIKEGLRNAITSSRRVGSVENETGETSNYSAVDLAAALNERGIDDYAFVADVYDEIAGNSTNRDNLNAYYERNRDMLPEADQSETRSSYVLAPLLANESYNGLKYAMDPAPYEPVGSGTEGTSDDPEVIANTFTVSNLKAAFYKALQDGDAQIRLEFPGQNGEEGPVANVPVEAIRDALQRRGQDTNYMSSLVAFSQGGDNTTSEDSNQLETDNAPATPASIGATPTPETSVTIESTDSRADLTATPSTGSVTAADVDLDETDGVDAYDPEVIMQVIRNQYPNAVEMSNGDLIVDSHETTDASGNRIEYQTVVVRTRQEFFYTYIRRINHAETDPSKKYQSLRYGRMSQSARALNNTIKEAKKRTRTVSERHGSNTMNRWWGEPGQRGRVQQENVNPDTNEPEHIREQPIDRETVQRIVAATSDEAVSEAVVLGVFRHITQHGASQTVLNRLRAQFGMTRESMNTIVDAVNEHVAKQDRIRRFDTWVSADGETPLFEGDTVRHADGRVGVVVRRIIEHRTHDYGYSDYLYIRFPGRRSDTNMTSRNLTLVSTTGGTDGSERRGPGAIQLPDPTLTTRAQNRMRREGRINDFAPEQLQTDRFSGPLPTVEINGTKYPVSGSRQTVIGDNMDTMSGDLSTAQVGDFTTTLDPETGALRVREIVGIEQNSDGTTTIYTFTPNDFGSGTAEGTTYSPDENGNFGRSVPLYRERPAEENGAATQREREALGTAVSEADPASVPEELKTRVEEMMSPDSTATPREVNDTAVEVSQLPKQEAGATDSVSLPEANDLLAEVQAEAPGDSIINLDNIETAAGLQGATPEEKMADAPAWFKNPMTPEAVEEKMGPAETPAAPVEMPAPTTPFEELPEEPTAPQIPEGESSSPVRTPDVIQSEIATTEEKLVRARSARDTMGDDPIVVEQLDARIADLESQLNDLSVELNQETAQGLELDPAETPFGTPAAPQTGDPVDGEFINGSPVGTEITTVIGGQKVTFKKNADGTWVSTDIVTLPDADLKFTPAPLSDEQMADRANTGNVSLG